MPEVRLRAGKYMIPVSIIPEGEGDTRLALKFGFNRILLEEIKAMDDAIWHQYDKKNPRKIWTIKNSSRNQFQLRHLMGEDVYKRYNSDLPILNIEGNYSHQNVMTSHFITRRQCIAAGEMGVGKSLSAIRGMEIIQPKIAYWIGPKNALIETQLEFYKWKSKIWPKFLTYEGLVKEVENWPSGTPAPDLIVFDEASKAKNGTAQRSKAAKYVADQMRKEYGEAACIWLMSGSPAPKSPADWWFLCEIACPGFLKEGNVEKFKRRLALIKTVEGGFDGGAYPKLITWWDDEKKCKECGRLQSEPEHDVANMADGYFHPFVPSINEISKLYRRVNGLVLVQFKKDCLDLPEMIFRKIICAPSQDTLRAMKLVLASATSTINGLILCRELSDGFQYVQIANGEQICPTCIGLKEMDEVFDINDPESNLTGEELATGKRIKYNDDNVRIDIAIEPFVQGKRKIPCILCNQKGTVPTYTRETQEVPCPKEDAINDLLDKYEEEGRVVLWAGFQASVDRLIKICVKAGWDFIRVDGRGWYSNIPGTPIQLKQIFNDDKERKIAFIGQPGAGGMGLNLTASSMEAYYSNTFNGEDRIQSLARIHRIGADHNRGCTVYDLIHLPTDLAVLKNLDSKIELQGLTMGLLKHQIDLALSSLEERTV